MKDITNRWKEKQGNSAKLSSFYVSH